MGGQIFLEVPLYRGDEVCPLLKEVFLLQCNGPAPVALSAVSKGT